MSNFKGKKKIIFIMTIFFMSMVIVKAASETIFDSEEVKYDNTASKMESENVQDAIDELYDKADLCVNINSKLAKMYVKLKTPNIVSSGDGLYDNGDGTLVYKGKNPNNYIKFNNETWRIMSIDNSGRLKIIKDERITLTGYSGVNTSSNVQGRFDASGSTGRRTSGYCSTGSAPTYGCNAWAAISDFRTFSLSGAVTADSELNTYLNGTYKNTLKSSSDWQYVQTNMTWNFGHSGYYNEEYSIDTLEGYERLATWTGDIALATDTDYMKANSNSSCLTHLALYNARDTDTCRTTNYLWKSAYWWWLLNPEAAYSGDAYAVLIAYTNGTVRGNSAYITGGSVRPVLYLKSNIKLSGTGASDSENIYKITGLSS